MSATKDFQSKCNIESHLHEPATATETSFRHSGWAARRDKVLAALQNSGSSIIALDHFQHCGSACVIEWSETLQKHRLNANYCHNRHCEPCQRMKANLMAANLKARLSKEADGRYRFITLTLAHRVAPLVDQVKTLYAAWKKLRKSKLWKQSQKGGAAVLEVKLSDALDPTSRPYWHAHLHVIAEGGWISQSALSAQWLAITGDSYIVHVRALDRAADAAAYLVKYVTKGTSPAVWNTPDLASEWICASRGVRTAATYGTWRGIRLLAKPAKVTDWQFVGKLDQVILNARGGDDAAAMLLILLRRPTDDDFDLHTAQ
jgi:hypothetical protein